METPRLSIVIPFYNEAESIPDLLNELDRACADLAGPVEWLLINDGSTDQTQDALVKTRATRSAPVIRVIEFAKNSGQAAALFYGIQHALGETIVTLDGDGQNDPADIPRLIDALADGDVAAGIRADRHDSFLRIAMSRFANGIRSRVLGDGIPDTGCGLKAFRNEVRHALVPIRTLYSFMPAMMCAAGYKIVQVPVHHRPRQKGVSKYGFMVFLWRPLVDMPSSAWFTHRCVNQALLGAISVTLNEPPPPGL